MDEDGDRGQQSLDDGGAYESERRSIERAMHAYAAFMRSAERFQKSVAEYRRLRDTHETMHGLLRELAANRESAASGRLEVRTAVRTYVHRLRAEDRAPEVALRLLKRTVRAIVLAMPPQDALRNPDELFDDTVRWAIEAYYDAA
jgi:hypothetical protein